MMDTQQTMMAESTASPEITRAAQRYLEQYGDPVVMNTYLKVALLALVVVCVALAWVVLRSHQALVSARPLIIRIDNVGRAEAVDYRDFQYRPQEAENKYYLKRWAELFFSRDRYTLVCDQTAALYFLSNEEQRDVIDEERRDGTIPAYVKDRSLPTITIVVSNVILDDLKKPPYSARIDLERIYTSPQDMHEIKREKLTASVTYVFRDRVANNELAQNPLGLTIIRFRFDQAFN
jgi:type IV secretory pathway TrbF-like protein